MRQDRDALVFAGKLELNERVDERGVRRIVLLDDQDAVLTILSTRPLPQHAARF